MCLIKVRIGEIINSERSLEEVYEVRGVFISGCNYVRRDWKRWIRDDIVEYLLEKMK